MKFYTVTRSLFEKLPPDDIRRVTGKPHDQCVRETFAGLDKQVIARFGAFVERGLSILSKSLPLFIVSNCQAGYIEAFLELNRFSLYFTDFECWGNTGLPKSENLRWLISRNSLKAPVYVGDTEGDRSAAEANDIPFFFVEYGFGQVTGARERFANFEGLVHRLLELGGAR